MNHFVVLTIEQEIDLVWVGFRSQGLKFSLSHLNGNNETEKEILYRNHAVLLGTSINDDARKSTNRG